MQPTCPQLHVRPQRVRWCALIATLLLAAGAYATGDAHAETARAARTCTTPRYPGLGYFTSLTVTDTSCKTGTELVFAYYRCRTRDGKAGTCHGTVLGFSCREQRDSIPTEIDARVTCHRREETVVHTYQQDT